MNRTTLIISGAIIVVLIIGFIFWQMNQSASQENAVESDTQSNTQAPENAASLALSAFEGSGSVKCTYSDETSQGTAYIKNGMVKIESTGTADTQYGNLIIKNDTLWAWEANGVDGFMMENISSYQDDSNADSQFSMDPEEVKSQITQSDTKCNEENISDITFEVPANVNFQNFSSMMEGMENQIPENITLPEGVDYPAN